MTGDPLRAFVSYAHEDDAYLKPLQKQLRRLEKKGFVKAWTDRELRAGADWNREINAQLDEAELILFLVSDDLLDSDYVDGVEMTKALQRHDAGLARVVPIVVRTCAWTEERIGSLQAMRRPQVARGACRNPQQQRERRPHRPGHCTASRVLDTLTRRIFPVWVHAKTSRPMPS